MIKCALLIDRLEAEECNQGSVALSVLACKIMIKGSSWAATYIKVKAIDAYELVFMLWVHNIILIQWNANSKKKDGDRTKKDVDCLLKNNWRYYNMDESP